MISRKSAADVRLVRKLAHGRRICPVVVVEEVQSVLGRLAPQSIRPVRSLLRRALAAESATGAMIRPEEESVASMLAACGVLRVEEKAEGDAAVYHWRPYRAAIGDGMRDEVRAFLGRLDPDQARTELLAATSGVPQLAAERSLLASVPSVRSTACSWAVSHACHRVVFLCCCASSSGGLVGGARERTASVC